jgi:hypothetical protein
MAVGVPEGEADPERQPDSGRGHRDEET